MTDRESIYRDRCPNYGKGPDFCCGARHEATRRRYESFTISIEYTDGRPCLTVSVFTLRAPTLERTEWQTIRLESQEVQEATFDWPYLTIETEGALRNIHPGVFTTSLNGNCPFR